MAPWQGSLQTPDLLLQQWSDLRIASFQVKGRTKTNCSWLFPNLVKVLIFFDCMEARNGSLHLSWSFSVFLVSKFVEDCFLHRVALISELSNPLRRPDLRPWSRSNWRLIPERESSSGKVLRSSRARWLVEVVRCLKFHLNCVCQEGSPFAWTVK